MQITIHQPEFFCWLGLLDKISKADLFVIMDDVQFEKNYYHNRNRIRTSQGEQFITVPVEKDNHKPINQVKIIEDGKWHTKILNSIKQNYFHAPYFNYYFPVIQSIICGKINQNIYITDINIILIHTFLQWFGIEKEIIYTSELDIPYKLNGSDKCLEICKKIGTNKYLAGVSGINYLNLDSFKEANIEVEFHKFVHPIYKQVYQPFIPGMSAIDLLFNHGQNSINILKGETCQK